MDQDIINPGYEIPPEMQGQVTITTLDKIYNWGRRSSIWPMMFGLACCAIEMICAATSRFDFCAFWNGNYETQSSPSRSNDRCWNRNKKNDPTDSKTIQSDA